MARRFASLDHLTGGRVGWNLVTSYSDSAARNLGTGQQTPHDERYDMAAEYLEVCHKLWEDSWDDDAVVRDAERGIYVDAGRVHDIDHHGRYFRVPGFAQCEPSPQRTPVIFQAGGSSKGRALAAASAEGVFVNAVSMAALKRQVDGLRALAAESGRDPRSIKVLQMLNVVVRARPTSPPTRSTSPTAGWSATPAPWPATADGPAWTCRSSTPTCRCARQDQRRPDDGRHLLEDGPRQGVDAPRHRRVHRHRRHRPHHRRLTGHRRRRADPPGWTTPASTGYNLANAVKYQDIADFIELVVPELQRRGRVQTSYEGSTLRETLYGVGASRLRADHPGARRRESHTGPLEGIDGSPETVLQDAV